MSDSRTFGVLLGAAVVIAALFAPWYAVDLSGPARDAISQQAGQMPGVLGEFAKGIIAVLPERIVADGWQVFEKTDIVLLVCALAAAFAALLGRLDVAALAGGGAGVTILAVMVNKPGPGGAADLVHMQWGPWAALAGAIAIVAAALMGRREAAAAPPIDWSQVTVHPAPVLGDSESSVAPPA